MPNETTPALSAKMPHGSNIAKKLDDAEVLACKTRSPLINEIESRYKRWSADALKADSKDIEQFIKRQTELFEAYRDFLDDPRVDAFDSRGALQPSALEEFCFYLLRPLLEQYAAEIVVGHYEVFQGLYFTASSFREFAKMPRPQYPVGNLDFVIAKKLTSELRSNGTEAASTKTIYVPAVAVECKTYLDRPRYIESDILATSIKRGFPSCFYVVLSEFLKLDLEKVNLFGSQIDKIYVLRRAQNVDRRIRRSDGKGLTPLHVPAVRDLFFAVKTHLERDWAAPEAWTKSGVLK